jgi:hypothetical protein
VFDHESQVGLTVDQAQAHALALDANLERENDARWCDVLWFSAGGD